MKWDWNRWPWTAEPSVEQHLARETAQRIITGNFERPDHTGRLVNGELEWVDKNATCPYCHCDLWEGPQGGMATNLICSNIDCRTRFNWVGGWILDYMGVESKEVYDE
jgi:hypothetical protein